eukprot:CCRYP_008895-RA/>CCRYP_008895-RA protein AED:0.37 eAED:0.37 QI:146/0.5/0.33/1/0.5/0.33/3/0/435
MHHAYNTYMSWINGNMTSDHHQAWTRRRTMLFLSAVARHRCCYASNHMYPRAAMIFHRVSSSSATGQCYRSPSFDAVTCRDASESLTFQSKNKWYSSAPNYNKIRRRRGLMRSRMANNEVSRNEIDASEDRLFFTEYTIDDSICPPTDPTVLRNIVKKHIATLPKFLESKPVAKFNADAFDEALDFVTQFGGKRQDGIAGIDSRVKVILDSGCGTGRSSLIIGERYPDCVVIGIDRSLVRLNKNKEYRNKVDRTSNSDGGNENGDSQEVQPISKNILLLRADLVDFWHLCLSSREWQQKVQILKHYLLYPNPYPKSSRLKSRFYAHPSFPLLMLTLMMDGHDTCDRQMIIRSNWKGYLEEFATAVEVWEGSGLTLTDVKGRETTANLKVACGVKSWTVNGPRRLKNETPLTNFEAKYFACGEPTYEQSATYNVPP